MHSLLYPYLIRTKFRLILTTLIWLSCHIAVLHAQKEEIDAAKDKVENKIKSVKDTLLSNHLSVAGNLSAESTYSIFNGQDNEFNYNLAANAVAKYKGLTIPFSYRFSNGRSIARFDGPAIQTPSFRAVGLSPKFKAYTAHIGDRTMDFSKYTYSNIRFTGFGIEKEAEEKGMYFKGFRGKLRPLSPADQIYRANITFEYNRKAWGGVVGYKNEKLDLKTIVFKANDHDFEQFNPDSVASLPKENTTISYLADIQLLKNITLHVEQAQSALTRNAFDDRIAIETHQTTKNIFGLFKKRTSSNYYKASRAEIAYELEKYRIGFEYETIDQGYLSLGSFFFDNNFIDYKINSSGQLSEKINYNISFGLRDLKERIEAENKDLKFIMNSSLNYQASEKLNLFANYSNFKIVQNSYYRTQNSTQVDSLILSQSNNSVSLGSSYVFDSEHPSSISTVYSFQSNNSVQNDQVVDDNIKNHLINFTYSKAYEKHRLNATAAFTQNKAQSFSTRSILFSLNHDFDLSEKVSWQNTLSYNTANFSGNQVNQIQISQNIEYRIDDSKSVNFDSSYDFSDSDERFQLNNIQLNLGAVWNIKPKTIMK